MDACDDPWGGGAVPGGATRMPEERLSVGPSAPGSPMAFPIPGDGEGQPDTPAEAWAGRQAGDAGAAPLLPQGMFDGIGRTS
eukprot:scaffold15710_cov134-Isochrysis_galbana.AAC.2